MKCPECKGLNTGVIDSRHRLDGAVRRRRVCLSCNARFSTVELHTADTRHATIMSNVPASGAEVLAQCELVTKAVQGLTDSLQASFPAVARKRLGRRRAEKFIESLGGGAT